MPDFPCTHCNKIFKENTHLNQHMLASHGMGDVQNKLPCDICNKSFPSLPAKQQHMAASHPNSTPKTNPPAGLLLRIKSGCKEFECSLCNRSYSSEDALQQHERDSHQTVGQAKQKGPLYTLGSLMVGLLTENSVKKPDQTAQATANPSKTVSSKRKPFPCSECDDSFDSEAARLQHMSTKHANAKIKMPKLSTNLNEERTGSGPEEHVCTTCYTTFETEASAVQHREEKKDHVIKKSNRKLAVDCFLKAALVVAGDKQESVALFRDTLKKIIDHIRSKEGGKIYSTDIRSAGSTAVNVKIGKADEFDTNIPLNIKVNNLITDGLVDYIYKDRIGQIEGQKYKINLNTERTIVKCPPRPVPEGQAVVKVIEGSVPANLVFGEDLIPHKCQKDFYDRVKAAIDSLNLKTVKLSREAHGPAITLTIVPSDGKHNISVDLTLSLACSLKLSQYGWPRESTKRALRKEKIEECLKAPIHLVPKGSDTWSISFSKAEEALLQGIDTGNECRRHVMQVMKRHLQILSSRKPLEGISSYIIKQQILWSAEKHTESGYWHQKNLDQCVIDVMEDFIETLRHRKLPLYFKPTVNILEHKRPDVLQNVADYFENEKSKWSKME